VIRLGCREVRGEVVDVPIEPWQRAHRVRLALRMVPRGVIAMENAGLDQRSRRTGNRRTERALDVGIGVMARDAIGAVDDFAAIDCSQFTRLPTSCGKGHAQQRSDRKYEQASGDATTRAQ
jgi:hypothetical protein